jgi:hypothetical protein
VGNQWPRIKEAIEKSLPPIVGEGSDKLNRILEVLLTGEMQCWAAVRIDKVNPIGFVLTTISADYCSGTKNLLVYCVYAYETTIADDWVEGLQGLSKYAKSVGCSSITGFSDNEKILNIIHKFGGNTEYRFIRLAL